MPRGRLKVSLYILLGATACASAGAGPTPDVEATLTRGGGLGGTAEIVRVWTTGSQGSATWHRSNARRAHVIHLPSNTLAQMLSQLDSLADAVPAAVPDTGNVQRLCGDVVTTQLTVQRGSRVRIAREVCPHLGPALESYWARVNRLFDVLASAAR